MYLIALGVNHKKTPIEIRERFYLTPTEQELFLSELRSNASIVEAFVLSTCNRVEVYAHVLDKDADLCWIIKQIFKVKNVPFSRTLREYFYTYYEREAVNHLLQVTTGLDSLVLGEKQILGQVKTAVKRAQEKQFFAQKFNILSNIAIKAGKKSHSETKISFGGSSISWAAMVMAEKIMGTLEDKSALIIGAGKMSEMAIRQLKSRGVSKLYLMNRTGSKAEDMAEAYNGISATFADIKDILVEVDVCMCASGAPHYILEKETVEKVMALRDQRQLTLVDISMPRNIDPRVSEVHNVVLTHIDDLDKVVEESKRIREEAVEHVERIIDEKRNQYYDKISKIDNSPDKLTVVS